MGAQHILILFHDFSFGGTEVVALRLAAEWVREGRRVTILCGTPDGPLRASVPPGVHVTALDDEIGRSPLSRLRLRRALPGAIARTRCDIMFLPGNFHLILAGAVRRLAKPPKVVAKISNPLAPGRFAPIRRLLALAYRWAARDVDWLVAMSSGLAADVRQLTASDTVSVIFDPNAALVRHVPKRPSSPTHGPLRLLAAGRLVEQKDFGLAIHIVAELAKRREVRLTLLGEGPERGALERLAARLGVAHLVDMPGHAPSIGPALARADLLLVTSRYEGGPAVAVEALEHGVPVIAADCSHFLRDLLAEPDYGMIVETRQPVAFAAQLLAWTDCPDRRPFSPQSAIGPFESGRAARSYLQLFDRLIDDPGHHGASPHLAPRRLARENASTSSGRTAQI